MKKSTKCLFFHSVLIHLHNIKLGIYRMITDTPLCFFWCFIFDRNFKKYRHNKHRGCKLHRGTNIFLVYCKIKIKENFQKFKCSKKFWRSTRKELLEVFISDWFMKMCRQKCNMRNQKMKNFININQCFLKLIETIVTFHYEI